jgi:drug/metabolite transporter (DMT)-like permease
VTRKAEREARPVLPGSTRATDGDPLKAPAVKAPTRQVASGLTRHLPLLALALLALIWGYNWVVMKQGLRYSQPFTFAALRSFLGAVTLFMLLPILRKPLRPKALGLTLALGLLQTTGFVGLVMWALVSGGAGKTSVLVYTMPFWLLLMAWIVLGERLHDLQWVAVGAAFCGLILILAPWHLQGGLSSFLAVAGGFCWAASAVVAKVLRQHHEVDLLSLTAWQMLLGSIPLILIAALTADRGPVWSGTFIWALAFNVILANAVGWVLWLYFLHKLPAGRAGIGSLAAPVIGVLAAWIQLGERPGPSEAVGMALVVGALILMTARAIIPRYAAKRDPDDVEEAAGP